MTAGERLILTSVWNGLIVFIALLVLGVGLVATILITVLSF